MSLVKEDATKILFELVISMIYERDQIIIAQNKIIALKNGIIAALKDDF
jgi:hypothetical protein